MLSIEEIRKLSIERQVDEIIVEKDYILSCILWGISQSNELKTRLVFKGGTALYKCYFPDWRFSLDLDFTCIPPLKTAQLLDGLRKLVVEIHQASGIYIKILENEIEYTNSA